MLRPLCNQLNAFLFVKKVIENQNVGHGSDYNQEARNRAIAENSPRLNIPICGLLRILLQIFNHLSENMTW